MSLIALVGHLNLCIYLRDCDPPRPDTPPLFPEGDAWFFAAASGESPTSVSTHCNEVYVQDDSTLIPAWLFDTETGSRTPVSPTGDSCPVAVPAPADSPPPQDSPRADGCVGPVIFGRWASVVPLGGVLLCLFSSVDGPLDRMVLPSREQAQERRQQALAFIRQRTGRGTARRLDLDDPDNTSSN